MKTLYFKNPLISACMIATGILGLACISSCSNDDLISGPKVTTPVYTQNDFFQMNGVQANNYTVDAATGGVVTGPSGVKVGIRPASLVTMSGQAVTGPVNVELKEVLKPSAMIFAGKPTIAIGNKILQSGGALSLKMTAGGGQLRIKNGEYVNISVPKPPGSPDKMDLFVTSETSSEGWWLDSSASWQDSGAFYSINLPNIDLPWINVDKFYNQPGAQYAVNIETSLGNFPEDEIFVRTYLVLKQINSVIPAYKVFQSGNFATGNIPEGMKTTVVCMGITKTKKFYFAKQDTTVGPNLTLFMNLVELEEIKLKEEIEKL
jgi:hypothetical protein